MEDLKAKKVIKNYAKLDNKFLVIIMNLLHLYLINIIHNKIILITITFQVYIQELIHKILMEIFMEPTKYQQSRNKTIIQKLMNRKDKFAMN